MNFCYPRDLKEGFNAFQVTTRFINEGAMAHPRIETSNIGPGLKSFNPRNHPS